MKKSMQTILTGNADALTGFIAGFVVGVIGMYVYTLIMKTLA